MKWSDVSLYFSIVDQLEKDLQHLKDVTLYRYPEQGHAFLNDTAWSIEKRKELGMVDKDTDPKTDEQSVRDLAWSRIAGFLKSHLK